MSFPKNVPISFKHKLERADSFSYHKIYSGHSTELFPTANKIVIKYFCIMSLSIKVAEENQTIFKHF